MVVARKLFSTNKFTWLHVPKTGGTWLHKILVDNAPRSWQVSAGPPAHVRLHEVPEVLEHQHRLPERIRLPILATVRNPWDWYVSFYFFLEQHRVNRTGGFALPRPAWTRPLRGWADHYAQGNSAAGFRKAMPKVVSGL